MSEIFKLSGMSSFKFRPTFSKPSLHSPKAYLKLPCWISNHTDHRGSSEMLQNHSKHQSFSKLWIHISELESAISQQLRGSCTGAPSQIVDWSLKHPWKKFESIWRNFFPGFFFFFWWFLLYISSRYYGFGSKWVVHNFP